MWSLATLDMGTVPDWFAAVGTVGTLFAGFVLLRGQLASLRDEADDHRQSQASSVAVWTKKPSAGDTAAALVAVKNGSSQPIYRLLIFADDEVRGLRLVRAITPVGPGFDETFPLNFPLRSDFALQRDAIDFEFDDFRGRTWRRALTGELTEITDSRQKRWNGAVPLLEHPPD